MIKKMRMLAAFRVFALSATSLMLAACGESTNLKDPSQITSTANCSDLASDTVTCVSGRFVDDVVENLNYSCDKVNSVTDVDGSFSCPVGSTVEFSLKNPDDSSETAKKIILGKATVKALTTTSVDNNYVYLTPRDIGAVSTGNSIGNTESNIVRLLQSLNSSAVAANLPTRTIVLSNDDKRKLVFLVATINPSDFALPADDFENIVRPFLDAISSGKPLISASIAADYLRKGVYSTVAGAYFVPNYFATPGYVVSGDSGYNGDYGGMRGINSSQYMLAATWTLVDRRGRVTGFGVYSTGSNSATPDKCKFLPTLANSSSCTTGQQPDRNILRQKPTADRWSNWTLDGAWSISYELLDASGTPSSPARVLSFTQGKMDRGAVAGSSQLYKNIFGEVPASTTSLGHWSLSGGSPAFSSSETSYTMVKSRSVAPTLDPGFWSTVNFPLNLKMSFWDSSCNPAGSTAYTCPVGTLPVTILADGNIVSNINGGCGANLDPETLVDTTTGLKEYPLGVVAQIFTSNSGSRTYLSPIMLIPDVAVFGSLRNVQMAANGIANSSITGQLRIRVDSPSSASTYLHVYDDSSFTSGNATDVERSGYWSNQVKFLKGETYTDGAVSSVADCTP